MTLRESKTSQGAPSMSVYHYTAVFEPAYDGGFIVTVPALAGLVTEGDTLEEACAMVKDAVQRLLESLMQHGEEIPVESSSATIESVDVELNLIFHA
jgi:antitoxin HicB